MVVVVVVECLREWTHEKLNGAGKTKVGQSLIVCRISNQSADELHEFIDDTSGYGHNDFRRFFLPLI